MADDELNPFFDAVGRFIMACQWLDFWLYFAVAQTTPGMTQLDAERRKPSGCIKLLRGLVDQVPAEDADELREALNTAEEVLATRQELVHGLHGPSSDPDVRISIRTSLREVNDAGEPLVIRGRLTRDRILTDRTRARSVGGLFQARSLAWGQHLGVGDDDDDWDGDTPSTTPGS